MLSTMLCPLPPSRIAPHPQPHTCPLHPVGHMQRGNSCHRFVAPMTGFQTTSQLDFRNCNQTNLQIFWVDRKAYKDPAWWWGIMPRTKSTAGSQTYLKESWQINCANRWVTESHASMFAGNGSWSMRQVTRCSFLAACAAWKLLVHVERYSPESPKISCRLFDLLLKTSWQRKTSPKKRQGSQSICQAAAVPQPMPAILPNVVTSAMQMAHRGDKRPWFWSRACVVERCNEVEVVVVEVEVEVVVVWLPMLPQPKKRHS